MRLGNYSRAHGGALPLNMDIGGKSILAGRRQGKHHFSHDFSLGFIGFRVAYCRALNDCPYYGPRLIVQLWHRVPEIEFKMVWVRFWTATVEAWQGLVTASWTLGFYTPLPQDEAQIHHS